MDYLEQLEAREKAGEFENSSKKSTGCDYLDNLIAKEDVSKKDQDSGDSELSIELKPKGFDYGL